MPLVMGPPVDQGSQTLVSLWERLDHCAELVLCDKEDTGLRVIDDELNSVLAQRIVQWHAVDGLPIARL